MKNKLIDYAGIYLIGILSFCYILFYRAFAKLYVNVPFIGSPFFVGDIIFVICFCLFFLKWLINNKNFNVFAYLFLSYFSFVVVKIIVGYLHWGPLALRHSVLFCYPLFALFTFSFFRINFFELKKNLFFVLVLFLNFKFFDYHLYFTLTCLTLTLVLINNCSGKKLRYLLYFLLLLVFPYKLLFATSRTFIIGNAFSLFYVGVGLLVILRIKKLYKIIFFLILVIFVIGGILKFSNRNEVRSLIGFDELINRYNQMVEIMNVREPYFVEPKLSVRLYNNRRNTVDSLLFGLKEDVISSSDSEEEIKANRIANDLERAKAFSSPEKSKHPGSIVLRKDHLLENISDDSRGVDVPYSNSLFRVFVWKDALGELKHKHPILGFDFGKPFRSHTLEVLNWAATEWKADGWICLHNSYIDLVYRSGVIGISMIIGIFVLLVNFTIASFRKRSLTGILLTGALINWFVAANFLEILEMPYSAIPIWSIFGLTFAYLFKSETA